MDFTKKNVEIYKLRGNHTWGDFVLEDLGDGKGQILINSDYGTWAYYWGAMGAGKGIREFLIGCDVHYLMGKFGGSKDWFDGEASRQNFKNYLEESFKNEEINKEDYDELMEEIENSDFNSSESVYWQMSDKMTEHFQEPFDLFVNDHEPGLTNFMKVIWPEFIRIIKEEITSAVPA